MVKNTKGGNKAKKQARKSGYTDASSTKARLSQDTDEIYSCCSKLLGNGMVQVLSIDGIERLCVIRNKFRGKGKRGNILNIGTWCLVGRRDFEKPKEGKLEKTDLLEVYSEVEKKYIVQKEIALKDKWKIFNNLGTLFADNNLDDESVSFQRNTELPPEMIDEESSDEENTEKEKFDYTAPDLGDNIDIDDI